MKKLTPSRMKTAKKNRIKIARFNWEKKHPVIRRVEGFGETLKNMFTK